MHNIILRPLFTEKISHLSEGLNTYGFVVAMNANKIEIKKAVEKKFNVKVEAVRTAVTEGKSRMIFRKSGRFAGKRSDIKKAFVVLKKGDKIDLFEQL
jgi:large subunit ribosomal protein L23